MASRGDRLLKFQRSGWSGDFKECKDEKNVWDDNFYELNRKHLELEREKLSDAKKSEPHPLDLCLTDNARETRGLNKIKRFCSSVDYKNVENPLPDAVKPLDALVKSAAVDERYLTESGKLEPVVSGLSSPLTPNGLLRRLKEVRDRQFLVIIIKFVRPMLILLKATPYLLERRKKTSCVCPLTCLCFYLLGTIPNSWTDTYRTSLIRRNTYTVCFCPHRHSRSKNFEVRYFVTSNGRPLSRPQRRYA
jgi:hypothetical protein